MGEQSPSGWHRVKRLKYWPFVVYLDAATDGSGGGIAKENKKRPTTMSTCLNTSFSRAAKGHISGAHTALDADARAARLNVPVNVNAAATT